MKKFAWIPLLALVFASCTKSETAERYLVLKFKFNDTLPRLDDTGAVAGITRGNWAVTPMFNSISANYVELASSDSTKLGQGTVLYLGAMKDSAIDFSQSVITKDGETFLQIPLSAIKAGSYKWIRIAIAYQNFDIPYRLDSVINGVSFNSNYNGTLASFIGFNTYFDNAGYLIKNQTVTAGIQRQKRRQGYWGFETSLGSGGFSFPTIPKTGQAADSATTVVNPLYLTSPVPKASSVVTAQFIQTKYYKTGGDSAIIMAPLVITGLETQSIIVECNLSTNKSFEWREVVNNKMWDPWKEQVIDMGIRGMRPIIK